MRYLVRDMLKLKLLSFRHPSGVFHEHWLYLARVRKDLGWSCQGIGVVRAMGRDEVT